MSVLKILVLGTEHFLNKNSYLVGPKHGYNLLHYVNPLGGHINKVSLYKAELKIMVCHRSFTDPLLNQHMTEQIPIW